MKSPIQQAKENLLSVLSGASQEVEEIIYPCLPQDIADYRSALDLVEVQQEFNRRGVKATLQPVSPATGQPLPKIVIATHEDVINGNLDNYLKRHGMS